MLPESRGRGGTIKPTVGVQNFEEEAKNVENSKGSLMAAPNLSILSLSADTMFVFVKAFQSFCDAYFELYGNALISACFSSACFSFRFPVSSVFSAILANQSFACY